MYRTVNSSGVAYYTVVNRIVGNSPWTAIPLRKTIFDSIGTGTKIIFSYKLHTFMGSTKMGKYNIHKSATRPNRDCYNTNDNDGYL